MRKRLNAFTLIELLVAMAVSAIVITAGYVSYGLMSRHFIDFRNNSNEMNQVVALQGILSHDMRVSKTVKSHWNNGVDILQSDNETVNYNWDENYVVRKRSTENDTFFLSVKKTEMHFCDVNRISTGDLIDGLTLTAWIKDQEFIFYFDKQYASDMLMQNENLNDGRH
jgi:prepilin-type N-terminal cleavage/methylation domain-containing protein